MSFTAEIAEFIAGIRYEALDEEMVEKSKEAFLDWLGVTLAALNEEAGRIIVDFVGYNGGGGRAPVIGTAVKTSAPDAALAMGTLSHALDFDDIYWPMIGHPSVTIFPAIFALGGEIGVSGKKAIEAFVAGFEVEAIIGSTTSEYHYHRGWHTTGTIGPLGSAAACAKLLDLSKAQIRNALGIATSYASGLRQNFGTMTKPLHAGNAARGGVTAALLAKNGFTADESILESELGFANVFCGKGEHRLYPSGLPEKPGKGWALLHPGRTVKKYPCCGAISASIDNMLDIRREHGVSPAEIEQVDCLVSPKVTGILIRSRPVTGLEGKFSMQYCLAVAALDGVVGLKQFSDERVARADVQDLLKKVNILGHETFERLGQSLVRVKTGRGVFEKQSEYAKGTPENPISYQELKDKFMMCADGIITPEFAVMLEQMVSRLDRLDNIKVLIELACQRPD
ncbi:MmgE/PrpD family protein [Desulfallas sp. Bu1-1]|uniref:MmgE/PrpD family protein n=1 Tax=Desulfallas sp. Bu1-1 TaxID=2787620 RepID=UPI00189E2D7F|nr:MmgE/PrpD family protein [Desulfallas sp. Bu1-1]MBF7084514.1 MmgE/PrpD family protein [Desulfallas sp. Bu1-1]